VLVFIHPQGDGAPEQLGHRFKGNGYLSNVIGNPLETTIALSHLIFEGTLASFPSLKICAAHAGGFLPSYAGPCDRGCPVRPDLCPGGTHGPIKKCPSEYLKQMYYDTMVFRPDGVRHLVAEVGASQLMVGTDYPYPWTTTAIDLIFEIPGLSDADSDRDPGGTAPNCSASRRRAGTVESLQAWVDESADSSSDRVQSGYRLVLLRQTSGKHFCRVAYSATSWIAIGLSSRRGKTSRANILMPLTAS